jgi:hypothetical protein
VDRRAQPAKALADSICLLSRRSKVRILSRSQINKKPAMKFKLA